MHSSGMRTALLLTASHHALRRREGVSTQVGVSAWGVGLLRVVCIPACNGADPPMDTYGVYPSMQWGRPLKVAEFPKLTLKHGILLNLPI